MALLSDSKGKSKPAAGQESGHKHFKSAAQGKRGRTMPLKKLKAPVNTLTILCIDDKGKTRKVSISGLQLRELKPTAHEPGVTSQPSFDLHTGSIQDALRDGYRGFVDAPVKLIESSWSKIGESLGRMEKKLQRIAG
jgi:hypothetical protein